MTLRVNGVEITDEAIQFELSRLIRFYSEHMSEAEVRNQLELLRKKARDQAVGARLLIEEAERLDFEVPEGEISARVEQMLEESGGREAFRELCSRQNMTEDMVRQAIARGRRVDMLIERVTEGLDDPGEEDIRTHYDAHTAEYTTSARSQAQHVLLCPASDNEADRATARSRLLDIKRRVEEDGEDFGDLAAAHSECPSGQRAGGSLGWVTRGTLVPEFDDVLFRMAPGTLSDVVETSLGLHLIRKTAHEDSQPADFDAVHDKIRDFLRHVQRGAAVAAYVTDLKTKAAIEED